jgi:hypothetical protein
VSIFERIEQACAAFIERTFARTFPSDLEPSQIARKLVSTMEAQTRDEDGRMTAPSAYAVAVNPDDLARLEPHREYLEREWAELIRELAGRVGIVLVPGEPQVRMAARESVPLGAVDVSTADAAAGATERERFRLRTVRGVPADGVYLVSGIVRIGRGDENEIVLADPSVSRTHAVVDGSGARAVVRDLRSTNGTFVNGRRVDQHELRDGDELALGNTRLRFEVLA